MPATIKDIAREVGLSITTVSRALNDYADVSQETKRRVRDAADKLGYIPNTLAQRFQKRKTDTLGLILPTFGPRFSDPFFSEFLAGIGNMATHKGYDLLVSTRAPGSDEMYAYQQMVQGHRVDGLLIVRTRSHDERIEYLMSVGFPFVAFGRTNKENDFPFVDEDSAFGMGLVTEHLVALGHRRIACIASPPELMFSQYRLDGLRAHLQLHDIPLPKDSIRFGDLTQRSGYEQAISLLTTTIAPTAIVACNDLMAFGAMSAAQDQGLIVGKDISITGFDNIPMASHSHPPLTTVHQPIYQIGSMICEMLVRCLKGEVLEPRQILLRPELNVRQSSGEMKGGD
jgi:LacI family transcriptional regulator